MTREDAKNRIHRHVGNGITQAMQTVDAIFDHFEKQTKELESENAKLKEPKGCNACNCLIDNVCNHPGIPEFYTPQYINYSGCGLHELEEGQCQ